MSDTEFASGVNDIAIVGMALRVPGARTVREFWHNLRNGVESIRTLSKEELVAAGETAERVRRKNYVPRAADLPDFAHFDAEFFGFSPMEAAIMDPQHRQFLECAWEALEEAGRPPESNAGPVGVFAGCGMGSYFYFNVCSHRDLVDKVGMFLLRHTGNDKDFLATRLSYLLDLHGPSVNVQTACSTSLVAVHTACQSLISGECETAIAGGVTIELPHQLGYLYQEGEILSPDGHCRAFDHRAAGTVFGSGAGVVVLRRLADALRDGDTIRAVIKATAVNNDGASKAGYLAPSVTGQAEAVVEALALAGVGAETIQYVECHGTGTYLGDPIEIEALSEAYRQSTAQKGFCRIGSVKTNIGHLDTAAGVVGLIKAVLALEHGEIPPTLNYEKPNPAIDFAASPFVVNDALTPWPRGSAPRRAGVNSLGVGGTNAHVVVEEAPALPERRATEQASPHVLVMSAKSRPALDQAVARLGAHLRDNPALALRDVAFTLGTGRRHFKHRRVVAVADRSDAIAVLSTPSSRRAASHSAIEGATGAVLLFSGGGTQYPGMAAALYRSEPAFARTVDEGLRYLPGEDAKRIRELWLQSTVQDAAAVEAMHVASLQLPAILILEVALARLWTSWGIKPTALIGHSMGENAAACVAGVLDFEAAVGLVHLRGKLMDEVHGGGMLGVPLPPDALAARLSDQLEIAAINAPALCVVTGPVGAIEVFHKELVSEQVDATRIPIDIAAHSRLLDPILARFEAHLRTLKLSPPQIPIISNVTGGWLTAAQATDPAYWAKHLRSTVRFADGLATLSADKARVYIEIGPGRTLSSLAKAQGTIDANQVINSLPHADEAVDDQLHFLTAVGRAWATGLAVPVERLWPPGEARRVSLPTYPFQHQRYFLDRVAAAAEGQPSSTAPVKLADVTTWGWQPVWKSSSIDTVLGAKQQTSSFLIFLDDAGVGLEMAARLRQHGHRVATVAVGDAFTVVSDGHYVLCPEHGREGYDSLVSHLKQSGGIPERIAHLWLLTADESHRPGSSFFDRNQERGFYSLFHLAQALSTLELGAPMQIALLTNGMQRVGDEALPYPEKATVLGPAQVMPREMPGISVRVIDIALDAGRDRHAIRASAARFVPRSMRGLVLPADQEDRVAFLWEELFADHGNEIVAYRGGRRWTRTYQQVTLEPSTGEGFKIGGVYLVTGGLGGLATTCAEELARRFKAKLVLVGRTELPDRAEWTDYLTAYGDEDRLGRSIAAIKRIEAAGGEVLYCRADITNPEAMRDVVATAKTRFGAINGALHTAGVVKDELIVLKAQSDIEEVFAPKVLGTMVLEDALKDEPIELIVLFSSTSTDTAPLGQVDYVAANAYLNAFAESRSARPGRRVMALHWGLWNEVGLAARAVRTAQGGDAPVVEAAQQPLLNRRVRGASGNDQLELRCEPARHWLLDEHRLASGEPVWPGTGYLELIAEAAREFGRSGTLQLEDLNFIRLLHVPDGEARTVRVVQEKLQSGTRLAVERSVDTPQGLAWIRHAEATLVAKQPPSVANVSIEAIASTCAETILVGDGKALKSPQEDHLRFGPRWRVLRSVRLGNGAALGRLQLDDVYKDDISRGMIVHPALMDIATGFAMALIPGYDPANGLWVPLTYGRVRIYRHLPTEIWSHVKLNDVDNPGHGFATFDIRIVDGNGRVLVDIERFTIKHLARSTNVQAALHDATGARLDDATQQGVGELSPALERLAVQVDQGINPNEGADALLRALATGLPQVVVSSIDLALLQQSAARVETAKASTAAFERPTMDSEFVGPRNEVEQTLAGFWSELLGVQKVGVNDNFFDLGGHSLVAVRLFRKIKQAYAVEFPISVLFEAPTIAQTAELVEQSTAGRGGSRPPGTEESSAAPVEKTRYTHLVLMKQSKSAERTPFFICAGMFGNILNLRHLAVQIGNDRAIYGLQARGLYGQQAPHETFEEMARDYLAEVRTIQPHGPYLLGGFSGGGLVAYEMAQQLKAVGEEVASLVMLDTPYPEEVDLSALDRLSMKMQDMRREGGNFFGNWVRRRIAWEKQRRGKGAADEPMAAERFHNEEIEAAFRRALARYQGRHYGGPVVNFRPKLEVAYRLRNGVELNTDRCVVKSDNGWSPLIADLRMVEVPGTHDSMVLEPNVRVLAALIREELKQAEMSASAIPMAAQ